MLFALWPWCLIATCRPTTTGHGFPRSLASTDAIVTGAYGAVHGSGRWPSPHRHVWRGLRWYRPSSATHKSTCAGLVSTGPPDRVQRSGRFGGGFAAGIGVAHGAVCGAATRLVALSRCGHGVGAGLGLFTARQPVWLEGAARGLWLKVRAVVQAGGQGAPCCGAGLGLVALWIAVFRTHGGGFGRWRAGWCGVMALFALGSGVSLAVGPWLWMRLRGAGPRAGSGAWGVPWRGPWPPVRPGPCGWPWRTMPRPGA